jgi:hypothetical protein
MATALILGGRNMALFNYGIPTIGSNGQERPKCWSASYDDGARECRSCSFQVTCKEEAIRRSVQAQRPIQQASPPQYFQQQVQYAAPQQYSIPQPIQVPMPIQQYHQPAPTQIFRGVAQPAPQLQKSIQVPNQQYGYGWIQDPLYYAISASPPPIRVQMGDESFFDRMVKNAGLAMVESFFGQCLLAVRQMVLPPLPRDTHPDNTNILP